ncbi:signal peptidase complex catalytic subunit SEC11C-like isoform X1 [Dioscorea cayenensis subsp. rotundata]|uniref:Signal peptidase complex catalytic subunit SEC11 n=2 Tax=Dioscorea cayennensis subsp. rotundata TaxID=55577 RepID=A0AB40C6T3_DIOCR|nr:signal peptidase complex catalytic subunit SEC11C-like isoform X1 [Dioscorea cayenensis subsp. rotundata]
MGTISGGLRSLPIRRVLSQFVSLGLIATSALMIMKGLQCVSASKTPAVVVLSESMEPGFKRGDVLLLHMSKDPIRAGEVVVFDDGRPIPIVHRVIELHERRNNKTLDLLTKGDNNPLDDRVLYAPGQLWLHEHHIMGRAIGFVPYVGWITIVMTEKAFTKYLIIGGLCLLVLFSQK